MRLLIKGSLGSLEPSFGCDSTSGCYRSQPPVPSVHLHRTLLLLQFGHQLPLLLRQQLLQVRHGLQTVVRRPGSLRGCSPTSAAPPAAKTAAAASLGRRLSSPPPPRRGPHDRRPLRHFRRRFGAAPYPAACVRPRFWRRLPKRASRAPQRLNLVEPAVVRLFMRDSQRGTHVRAPAGEHPGRHDVDLGVLPSVLDLDLAPSSTPGGTTTRAW